MSRTRHLRASSVVVALCLALVLVACASSSSQASRQIARRAGPSHSSSSSPVPVSPILQSDAIVAHLRRLSALEHEVLESYITRSGPSDPRYWSDGTFYATDGVSCWFCYDSGAVAAAVLSQEGRGNSALATIAIDTYTTAIKRYQLPDGEIELDGSPDSVGTTAFMADLGITDLELRKQLTPSVQRLWTNSMRRAADWLISAGQTTFYINGNVNLGQTVDLWLAWALTGDRRFYSEYQKEWAFALYPPQPRWKGYGLMYSKYPTDADGADGSGYLTESGGSGPGFDPSYTQVQLDIATSLYVLTRNPRYLRLMNLLFNQDQPLVNPSFILQAFNGSRKNDIVAFTTPGPAILVLSGIRPDLLTFWLGQLEEVHQEYTSALSFSSPNVYKGLSEDINLPLLFVQWPNGLLGHRCTTKELACRRLF